MGAYVVQGSWFRVLYVFGVLVSLNDREQFFLLGGTGLRQRGCGQKRSHARNLNCGMALIQINCFIVARKTIPQINGLLVIHRGNPTTP